MAPMEEDSDLREDVYCTLVLACLAGLERLGQSVLAVAICSRSAASSRACQALRTSPRDGRCSKRNGATTVSGRCVQCLQARELAVARDEGATAKSIAPRRSKTARHASTRAPTILSSLKSESSSIGSYCLLSPPYLWARG